MDRIFYLASCDTCRKIIKSLPANKLVFQDIRQEPITPEQLDGLKELSGSYEALFSRKAQLYTSRGLKDQKLTETDYRNLILEHYTFLSRPVFVIDNRIYIGNSQANVAQVLKALS